MRPTLRERVRWWRWFLAMPSPLDRLSDAHGYDRESYRILVARLEGKEPWPRVRQDKWIFR